MPVSGATWDRSIRGATAIPATRSRLPTCTTSSGPGSCLATASPVCTTFAGRSSWWRRCASGLLPAHSTISTGSSWLVTSRPVRRCARNRDRSGEPRGRVGRNRSGNRKDEAEDDECDAGQTREGGGVGPCPYPDENIGVEHGDEGCQPNRGEREARPFVAISKRNRQHDRLANARSNETTSGRAHQAEK